MSGSVLWIVLGTVGRSGRFAHALVDLASPSAGEILHRWRKMAGSLAAVRLRRQIFVTWSPVHCIARGVSGLPGASVLVHVEVVAPTEPAWSCRRRQTVAIYALAQLGKMQIATMMRALPLPTLQYAFIRIGQTGQLALRPVWVEVPKGIDILKIRETLLGLVALPVHHSWNRIRAMKTHVRQTACSWTGRTGVAALSPVGLAAVFAVECVKIHCMAAKTAMMPCSRAKSVRLVTQTAPMLT